MSEMEFHVGTAHEICGAAPTFDDKVADAVENYGMKVEEMDVKNEYLYAPGFAWDRKSGRLFLVNDEKHRYGYSSAAKTGLYEYNYVLHFYNGGTHFEECLSDAINKEDSRNGENNGNN